MRKIFFDIETKNTFYDIPRRDPTLLDIALVAIYDSETDKYESYLEGELSKLWPILERADMLIGFNSDHFDLPLLDKYYPGDLTKIKHLDILKEIKENFGRRMKLDQIAEGTLDKKKIGNGLEAITWWKNGEIDRVREYCIEDVRITKEVYDHALEHNELIFKEGGKMNKIPLDTSTWEDKSDHKLTFSLPF